jgi:hypothetical protein
MAALADILHSTTDLRPQIGVFGLAGPQEIDPRLSASTPSKSTPASQENRRLTGTIVAADQADNRSIERRVSRSYRLATKVGQPLGHHHSDERFIIAGTRAGGTVGGMVR